MPLLKTGYFQVLSSRESTHGQVRKVAPGPPTWHGRWGGRVSCNNSAGLGDLKFAFFFFFICNFIYLFIRLWLCRVSVAAGVVFSSRNARDSRCGGFSGGARSLWQVGLRSCGSRTPECQFRSCGARGTWDLPRSVREPVSPAPAGRFFTTEPPEKPGTSLSFI